MDGRTALDMVEASGDNLAMLLTEVVLPVMNGLELIKCTRAFNQGAYIGIVTAQPMNQIPKDIDFDFYSIHY